MSSVLSPMQRYAAGGLFGMALYQAQTHQTRLLGSPDDDEPSGDRISSSSSDSVSEDPQLWVHESCGLLRPIFRFLEIDKNAWTGLEETTGSSPAKHHIGAFLRLLAEGNDTSLEMKDKELSLSKAIDAVAHSMETTAPDLESKTEKHREYEHDCRQKFSNEMQSNSEVENKHLETLEESNHNVTSTEEATNQADSHLEEKPSEEVMMLSYPRKLTVLYELLSACLANIPQNKKNLGNEEEVMMLDIVQLFGC